VDGTPNSNGLISKLITVELLIGDHFERLVLVITKLSTHAVFLRYNWLKEHNLVIDWKKQTIGFTCSDEHLPTLISEEDEHDHVGYKKEEEQVF
jgi:hypothetical protein